MLKTMMATLCLVVSLGSQAKSPKFSNFEVEVSQSIIKQIDVNSHPDAPKFKTLLNQSIGSRANFAGKYYIVETGCGSMCQLLIVIDVATGKVIDTAQASLGSCFAKTAAYWSSTLISKRILVVKYPAGPMSNI